jgi:hypothetical protein
MARSEDIDESFAQQRVNSTSYYPTFIRLVFLRRCIIVLPTVMMPEVYLPEQKESFAFL